MHPCWAKPFAPSLSFIYFFWVVLSKFSKLFYSPKTHTHTQAVPGNVQFAAASLLGTFLQAPCHPYSSRKTTKAPHPSVPDIPSHRAPSTCLLGFYFSLVLLHLPLRLIWPLSEHPSLLVPGVVEQRQAPCQFVLIPQPLTSPRPPAWLSAERIQAGCCFCLDTGTWKHSECHDP